LYKEGWSINNKKSKNYKGTLQQLFSLCELAPATAPAIPSPTPLENASNVRPNPMSITKNFSYHKLNGRSNWHHVVPRQAGLVGGNNVHVPISKPY
jgi:hypothetical protein